MSDSNPILKNVRNSAGMRIAVLFGSFFVFLLLSSILSLIVDELPGQLRTHMLLSSVIQNILAFCIPAFLLARFSSNQPGDWLHLKKLPPMKAIYGVIIIVCFDLL